DDDLQAALRCPWPVLVNFRSPNDARSPRLAMAEIARQWVGRLKVVGVDVNHAPLAMASFGVLTVPSLYLVRDQLVIAHRVGAAPLDRLLDWLEYGCSQA